MWPYPTEYDVIVIGAGHAGCEAAHIAARMGARALLLTMNLDTIGKMSCNPSIGGTAKGHIVREVDALGGLMGKIADRTCIQVRMLNASKGPSVRSPRGQADKAAYSLAIKYQLEKTEHLDIKQGTIESLLIEDDRVIGVTTLEGIAFYSKSVVLSSGTFMRGLMHIGPAQFSGGRGGDKAATGLSPALEKLGLQLGRLKTGTPPRIHRASIDFSQTEEQPGDSGVRFSYDEEEPRLPQIPCHITYTTDETKQIVQENLHRSAMYSGQIHSVGPRYCPSIEDKIVRFGDKERHQIFLEPEGLQTEEIYVNGISTSFPFDVQLRLIRSVIGLEHAEIMRPAYAIEYDYLFCGQIYNTLEAKQVRGLFFAGQINGTTGYEEAAGQGLIAGTNAAASALGLPPFCLSRSSSYIGVMIDDLITKQLDEPYRMFTSRAEHRLLLRQDNADLRLRPLARQWGLISEEQYSRVIQKRAKMDETIEWLRKTYRAGTSLAQLLCRPESSWKDLELPDLGEELSALIETEIKYEGYIKRQEKEVERLANLEGIRIPRSYDYDAVIGLRFEARDKLKRFTPETLGIASRISGVSAADLSVLMIALQK